MILGNNLYMREEELTSEDEEAGLTSEDADEEEESDCSEMEYVLC